MTVIKNCPNCGGEHWGSLRCPFLPGELHKTIRPWPSLPNRDVQARRAADPTPEQRSWYRGMAEEFGLAGADWATTAFPAPVSLAYRHSRIAAHYGRLALGQREEE